MELEKLALTPYPLADITPEGWLRRQLQIQAQGLSGQLDKFWPDIKDSQWIGGSTEGWERVPYWLDGFIPLAYLLEDADMQARAARYIDTILARQQEDGWICPGDPAQRGDYDVWAYFLILKVLTVYHHATGDSRIEEAVYRAFSALDLHINSATLFDWAQTRWFEALLPLFWLYERRPEAWLLKLARKLHAQGFDWVSFYSEDWPYKQRDPQGRWSQMSHVVNQAMMLKSGPLYARLSKLPRDRDAAKEMLELLDRYHGMITGIFTGDECLAGKSPVQGTELCAVVEMMFSLEQLLTLTGDPAYGDRLEQLAFNALPATLNPDMTTHQYDQLVNQPACIRSQERPFISNGPEAHLFGVEPDFGCCTANFSQGWPKFASSLFMGTPDGGIAITAYAPATLHTQLPDGDVILKVATDYPFRNRITLTLQVPRMMSFPLWIRIPQWAKGAAIIAGNEMLEDAVPGTFYRLERFWQGSTVLAVILPMKTQLHARDNGLYAITRGPLVYSIPISYEIRHQDKPEAAERPWLNNDELLPTGPWEFALAMDAEEVASLKAKEKGAGNCPFSPEGAPCHLPVKVRAISWGMEHSFAKPIPDMAYVSDTVQTVDMIPYGCTMLRMTELPLIK